MQKSLSHFCKRVPVYQSLNSVTLRACVYRKSKNSFYPRGSDLIRASIWDAGIYGIFRRLNSRCVHVLTVTHSVFLFLDHGRTKQLQEGYYKTNTKSRAVPTQPLTGVDEKKKHEEGTGCPLHLCLTIRLKFWRIGGRTRSPLIALLLWKLIPNHHFISMVEFWGADLSTVEQFLLSQLNPYEILYIINNKKWLQFKGGSSFIESSKAKNIFSTKEKKMADIIRISFHHISPIKMSTESGEENEQLVRLPLLKTQTSRFDRQKQCGSVCDVCRRSEESDQHIFVWLNRVAEVGRRQVWLRIVP